MKFLTELSEDLRDLRKRRQEYLLEKKRCKLLSPGKKQVSFIELIFCFILTLICFMALGLYFVLEQSGA